MALNPVTRRSWRGVTANLRTIEMLEITELRALMSLAPLSIPQGSYNAGGVSASGGTHDGGGVIDVSVRNLTSAERDRVVRELRETSFAAWYRAPLAGVWPAHIHAVAIGDRELSPQAAWQVQEYKAGRDGLARQGPDNGPSVPIHVYRQDIDMSYYGFENYDDKDWQVFFNRAGWGYDVEDQVTDPPTKMNAKAALEATRRNVVAGVGVGRKAVATVAQETEDKVDKLGVKVDQILEKLIVPPA